MSVADDIFDEVYADSMSWVKDLAEGLPKKVTCKKPPPGMPFRMVDGRAAGIHPPYQKTYQRRIRIEGSEEPPNG